MLMEKLEEEKEENNPIFESEYRKDNILSNSRME